MNENAIPVEFRVWIDDLWGYCAFLIVAKHEYPDYIQTIRSWHHARPKIIQEQFPWPLALAMARAVWRQTPSPRLNFALPPLPTPERNAPCHCGSGLHYRQCCLPVEQAIPVKETCFLPLLLEQIPRREWPALVGSRVPIPMLAHTASELGHAGRYPEVIALLEPWFADDGGFRHGNEELFDGLLDAYSQAPKPRKKAQLLERAIRVGDRRIRSAALQRKASMLSDEGDYPAAWATFAEAQRADPQSPSLSHLEVILLLSQGRAEEARERARFWAHRLAAMRDPGLEGLIGFMRQVVERGDTALTDMLLQHRPDVQELLALLHAAPPVRSLYSLKPADGQAGPLKPKPALAKALRAFEDVLYGDEDAPWANDPLEDSLISDLLPLLRKHPELWNSFDLLNALVDGLRAEDMLPFKDVLARPLLDRAESLLHEVLRANAAEGLTLEWGWLPNRPALHLLGERIAIDSPNPQGEAGEAQLARMEWLVRTLNPNDNQGFRHGLMRAYLQRRRFEDALEFSSQYPDDFAAMRYNRALALYAAAQPGRALTALREAADQYPKLLAWLLKDNPKQPKPGRLGIQVGGDEEAWLYRQDMRPVWTELGALDWARNCAKAFKGKRRES